jgi:hypothetical protein
MVLDHTTQPTNHMITNQTPDAFGIICDRALDSAGDTSTGVLHMPQEDSRWVTNVPQ